MPSADNSGLPDIFKVTNNYRYPNPFYNVPQQFFPKNIDHMILWAEHFLYRFPFYKPALERIANYFITTLKIDGVDTKTEKKYLDTFESLKWKTQLTQAGINLLSYGNEFCSFNAKFLRVLICPKCGRTTVIDKVPNYVFDNGNYLCKCSKCGYSGPFKVKDRPYRKAEAMFLKHWNIKEVKIQHDTVSGYTEHYWDIPAEEQKRVMKKGNKFYSKVTPSVVFEAIASKTCVKFSPDTFLHLKLNTPSSLPSDGRAIPPCIFLFDEFFMAKVIERQSEAIALEDIVPFRIFSFAAGPNDRDASPVINQSGAAWRSAVEEMIEDHRRDPAGYHIFPFPVNEQRMGGDGQRYLPVEVQNRYHQNILNALNIPMELYQMNLQAQAIGPALRLFENSYSHLVSAYNDFLQKWADVISKIEGLESAKVRLSPISMADNIERKQIIMNLASANAVAKSTLLETINLKYEEELRKRIEEEVAEQEIVQEEQRKQEVKNMTSVSIFGANGQQQVTPQDQLAQAQEKAQELVELSAQSPGNARKELQAIKAQDQQFYALVKQQMEEIRSSGESQGRQAANQGQLPQG